MGKQSDGNRKRGQLKIYLGMAAGVGKTYSMLSDARNDLARGYEVVIGYLEAHGRVETEELAVGMEKLPLREQDYRGVTVREFDLDGALARSPEFLLVDELAHTNADGSRHSKRWQDVAELLAAGINVRTTVNIQHLESLRDVVAQVTGVFVQETVPDSFLDSADEVELVDLPPEELHKRLQEGKVYVPEKIEQAMGGFFKKSNLLALRELSLRHTAERVDAQMREARTYQRVTESWHARERILVCIAPNRMAPRVVRAAKRLAANLHADLIAATVDSPRQSGLNERSRAQLDAALTLAETLGARTVSLAGEDIVEEVLRYSRAENITTIVVGKPIRKRWKQFVAGSMVDALIRESGEIDILVITGAEEHGTDLFVRRKQEPTPLKNYAVTLAAVLGATGLGQLMFPLFDSANIVMVYLLVVAAISISFGRNESALAAVLSVALFDFCFVHPTGTFAVSDAQYLVTFGIMLLVSLLISSMNLRLKSHSLSISKRERDTAALYELSRQLASSRKKEEMADVAARHVADLAGCHVGIYSKDEAGKPILIGSSEGADPTGEKELGVVGWVLDNGQAAGSGTDTLAGSEGFYLPLTNPNGCFGAIGLTPKVGTALEIPNRHLLESVANQLATSLDRAQLAKASHESSVNVEREKLRSNLLSSVSHDLRTPLASIEGAASGLAEQSDLSERSRTLALTVVEESQRMGRLVRDLLDMSRFEGGGVTLNLDWQSLEELIGSAIERTRRLLPESIITEIPSTLPPIMVDGVFVEQVFVNLLENAVAHGGKDVHVWVKASLTGDSIVIAFSDDGKGLPAGEEQAIFEKFRKRGGSGFGLGLAICQAVMTSHGGTIRAQNREGGGAEFILTFPLSNSENP
ncbi:MAG: sensor histidine kinase KdpD [Armatimonadetes bacterium]|nr:sensor histidine kinase KdpD [Armatimonadota bacterium]